MKRWYLGNKALLRFNRLEVSLRCVKCGSVYEPDPYLFSCPKCGSPLEVVVRPKELKWLRLRRRALSVWRYRELLPVPEGVKEVSMGEGGTPLIRAERIASLTDVKEAWVKFEGANPTGSFKDRGMTVGVTIAKHVGVRAVIVASTGNTSASASAYAARAGIKCFVVLPKGKVARGKLSQAVIHGAVIVEVAGSFDDALEAVMEVARRTKLLYPLNSFNPWRLEGQKTIAYEIYDQLGRVPRKVIVPVGNAGNIAAIWKGFKELKELGVANELPEMVGVQAAGAAPIANAFERGLSEPVFIDRPETVATAIRIGRPVNWYKALNAVRESNGVVVEVGDSEILEAQGMLARLEGVGAEPAGAAPLAGLIKLSKEGLVGRDDDVVLVVTGHTLKDPDVAVRHSVPTYEAKGSKEVVATFIDLTR
ncbi:MAG: threonine synthase [Desulfurococcales archaeon ex4484_204]|nr:MAG: threonine synthase [Desulfurococcales archaeon ex4484_204]